MVEQVQVADVQVVLEAMVHLGLSELPTILQ
jgi:hypothetical protein